MNAPTPTPSGRNQRTLAGLFIRPQKQVRFAMLFIGGAMLSVVALLGFLVLSFNHALARYNEKFHAHTDIGLTINDSFTTTFVLIITLGVILGLLSIYLGIRISHRIYGPLVPLKRHIEKLTQGDYTSRVRLRKDDEMGELSDALNELAMALESRHKN